MTVAAPPVQATPDEQAAYDAVAEVGTLRDIMLEAKRDRPAEQVIVVRNGDDSLLLVAMSYVKGVHPGDLDNANLGINRRDLIERVAKYHGLVCYPLFHKDHIGGGLPHGLFLAAATHWPPYKQVAVLPNECDTWEPQAEAFRRDMTAADPREGREALRRVIREQVAIKPESFRDAYLDRAIAQGVALALLKENP